MNKIICWIFGHKVMLCGSAAKTGIFPYCVRCKKVASITDITFNVRGEDFK